MISGVRGATSESGWVLMGGDVARSFMLGWQEATADGECRSEMDGERRAGRMRGCNLKKFFTTTI